MVENYFAMELNDEKRRPLAGHVATVVAYYGIYDTRLGPRISQAGMTNGEMWVRQGFTSSIMPLKKSIIVQTPNPPKVVVYAAGFTKPASNLCLYITGG